VGVSRDCPTFLGTPYYLTNGYRFPILYAHSQSRWEQKTIEKFAKNSRGVVTESRNFQFTHIYAALRGRFFDSTAFLLTLVHFTLHYTKPKTCNSFLKILVFSSHDNNTLLKVYDAPEIWFRFFSDRQTDKQTDRMSE